MKKTRTPAATVTDQPVEMATPQLPHRLCYRISEFAEAMSISRARVYEIISAGKLKCLKVGGSSVIPFDEALRFLAALPPAEIGKKARDGRT